jgi:S1-C subfamily serine protease
MEEYGTFSKQYGTIQNNGVVSRDVFDSVITNMNVSKGNSGSPILNENGKVIALTSWFIPNQISGGVCGVMLKTIVQKLLNEKVYTRGYIGFSTIPLFPKDILGYNISFTHYKVFGVIVTRTYISEICENDIITHINSVELNMNTQSLESLVYLKNVGSCMYVTFHKYNNGGQWDETPQTINVIVQEYPEVEDIPIINGKKELLR